MDKQWKSTTTREDAISTPSLETIVERENQQEIAALAYELWQERGCPEGSPEVDWFEAKRILDGFNEPPLLRRSAFGR